MGFHKHTDLDSLQVPHVPVVYYQKAYLETQQHNTINLFQNDSYFIPFSVSNNIAISFDRSPFGSFLQMNDESLSFSSFVNEIDEDFSRNQIEQVIIKHPSAIYSDFVDSTVLSKVGYRTEYNDINQHIVISEEWEDKIHTMQTRKLKTLRQEGFEFRIIPNSNLKVVYQFLVVCRQTQGLIINVSLEKLQTLINLLPGKYELFGVYRETKLSAVCITVNATNEIAYYYLAGTSPLFRSQSPMVLLISGMIDYYRKKGFKYFDLGVSSIEGNPQETLRTFKQRMGAQETIKPTLFKSLK